ncbi:MULTISPECIES: fumarylacetoacetate hydrolase family protein [unclassified Vibrio]|uniref:Fumarylacetoacetate hydrolase family protein n=1 Tax=Vibrio sp. HB236076 TaxID=3232307 RepID=A0AB39HKC2_9VIBR|nr:fumarylacetoacetate hydrolase family protein [Vibrio sp. HB161653]MDP5252668.1 fumarylacetoacetate hydrolase family protein [Vibrio sp. HB161653]
MQTITCSRGELSPSKVVCVGRNYVEHIRELNNETPNEMVVFHKSNSAISAHLHSRHLDEPLHYEAELCFLVERGQFVSVAVGLDLTKRETQSRLKGKGLPWEKAKSFHASALFSRFVDLGDMPIEQLKLELLINSVRVQAGGVSEMIHKPEQILTQILAYTDLEDGDIVMTGTPKGVGVVEQGDVFLARLKNADTIITEIQWVAQ